MGEGEKKGRVGSKGGKQERNELQNQTPKGKKWKGRGGEEANPEQDLKFFDCF